MDNEIVNQFADYIVNVKAVSKNTVSSYVLDITGFCKYVNDRNLKIERMNKTSIQGFLLELQKSGKKTSTISRNVASLRSFFRFLYAQKLINDDPTITISPPKVEKKPPEIISLSEIELLLEQPKNCDKGKRDRAMLELLYATGLRVSELISLKATDVNLQLGYIKCIKKDKERIIPLGSKSVSALKNYIDDARFNMLKDDQTDILFVNCLGTQMTRQGFWKIIKSYAKKADIQLAITPKSLRHSFAAHMVSNGADLPSIQELLGHSDISTTKVYAQFKKSKLKEVYLQTHPRA